MAIIELDEIMGSLTDSGSAEANAIAEVLEEADDLEHAAAIIEEFFAWSRHAKELLETANGGGN